MKPSTLQAIQAAIQDLVDAGLITRDGDRLILTEAGLAAGQLTPDQLDAFLDTFNPNPNKETLQ